MGTENNISMFLQQLTVTVRKMLYTCKYMINEISNYVQQEWIFETGLQVYIKWGRMEMVWYKQEWNFNDVWEGI